MGLHIALLAAAARLHRKRHGNARAQRRLRPICRNHRAELTYRSGLLQLVRRCRELINGSIGQLQVYWPRPTSADGIRATDSLPPSLQQLIGKAKTRLGDLDGWAKRMAVIAVQANKASVDKRLAAEIHKAIGVDVLHILQANGQLLQSMTTATRDNVALIKSIPGQYFERVAGTISEAWTQGLRWESMVEQIQRDGDITENRAKLIARDQTSKMNAAFNQQRQQQVGIERFEWSTSEDERVRESHAELDGKTFDWDSPPTVDGEVATPGTPINCRCVALPIVDMEVLGEAAGSAEQEQERVAA